MDINSPLTLNIHGYSQYFDPRHKLTLEPPYSTVETVDLYRGFRLRQLPFGIGKQLQMIEYTHPSRQFQANTFLTLPIA